MRVCRQASRVVYVPGPGDVQGTYSYWVQGARDESNPALTYSEQTYAVAESLGLATDVLTALPVTKQESGRVKFYHLQLPFGSGLAYHVSSIAYALRIVWFAIRKKADIVCIQTQLLHVWPLLLLRILGIALIFSLHNTLWPTGRDPTRRERIYVRLNRPALASARKILCISDALKSQLQKVGVPTRKLDVHVPQYASDKRDLWRDRSGDAVMSIVYLGRIEYNKGVFDLFRAFESLAPKHPRLRLDFFGGGTALEDLRHATLESGIHADRIRVHGATDAAGVYAALEEADLLVCPTTAGFAEGLAKTPIEAALCGIPSIVTDSVPARDLLPGSTMSVPSDNPTALANAIEAVISDERCKHRLTKATFHEREKFFDDSLSYRVKLHEALRVLVA